MAKEICNILGYANGRDAVSSHCKYQKLLKGSESLLLGFGPRGVILILEPDLYREKKNNGRLPEALVDMTMLSSPERRRNHES